MDIRQKIIIMEIDENRNIWKKHKMKHRKSSKSKQLIERQWSIYN